MTKLSKKQAVALTELLRAAREWREEMVRSNGPYPNGEDGRAFWSKVSNCNGRLVQAVDAAEGLLK